MRFQHYSPILVWAAIIFSSCRGKQPVDLIVYGANIYTVDSVFRKAEALAVKDGKIFAVGSDADIEGQYTAMKTVDAGGQAVYPGFIDAHGHFVSYGSSLFTASLFGSDSFEEVVRRVKQFSATHPGLPWVIGRGWDQNKFPD